MIHYIYKIINKVNGKLYVGYTNRKNPISRWNQHITVSKTNNRPLYKAIRKYGIDNFEFNVIYCSLDGEHTLKTMEAHFITQYQSFITEHGYNLTRGGESNLGWQPTSNTRLLWSVQRSGRTLSDEHKEKLSTIRKQIFQNNPSLRDEYRQRALASGCRPPLPTPETHQKGAITRTGKHIHTLERKQQLSDMFTSNTHPLQQPDLIDKRKATWQKNKRGQGEKNGNAVFCKVFNPSGDLIGAGYLRGVCKDLELPFDKFLLAARHGNPLERGCWKGWRIEKINK
jgi:group I intron endonuclease